MNYTLFSVHAKLLGMAVFWGAAWPWARMVAQSMPPVTGAALRFLLAAFGLFVWLFSRHRFKTVRALSVKQWGALFVASLFGVVLYNIFFMLGLQILPASRAAVVISLNPVLTLLLAAWFFKEKFNAFILTGMIAAVTGALTAMTQGKPWQIVTGQAGSGEWLILGCVGCWVVYTFLGRLLLARIDALTATAVSALMGGTVLSVVGFLMGDADLRRVAEAPVSSWAALLAMAFASTTLGYSWYFDGVKALGAGNAAAYITLVPLFGIGASILFLGEPLNGSLLAGAAIAIFGMGLMHYGQSK